MADERRSSPQMRNMPNISGRPAGGPMGARLNAEKPKNMMQTLGKLFRYIGKSRAILVALLALVLAVTCIDILGPKLQQEAIDTISFAGGKVTVDFDSMRFY